MINIGIIGPMNIEIELIKDSIIIQNIEKYAGFVFYIGIYEDINVVLTSSSVGKVNAASCSQILIDKFNITHIINTGIAGSLNNNINICDIVISNNVTYHDVRPFQMKNCFPYKESFIPDKNLIEIATLACKKKSSNNFNYHIGRIVTGESFISDNKLKKVIIDRYNPYCVEMEGAAIAHVCDINNIPFIIIRSISDKADDRASVNYEEFEKNSANNSAMIIIEMLNILSIKNKGSI